MVLSLCRLRQSSVLIIGIRGLGSEVSKNVVLAGVREVTVLDHTSLMTQDTACRFLMQAVGQSVRPNAQYSVLNPVYGYIKYCCCSLTSCIAKSLSRFLHLSIFPLSLSPACGASCTVAADSEP